MWKADGLKKTNPFETVLVQDHPKLEQKWGKLSTASIPKRLSYQTRIEKWQISFDQNY